jgi:hypothetical protein
VRAFLNAGYKPVRSRRVLGRLLKHEIKRSTDNLEVEAYEFTPDGMHVEIYDPETHTRTGDHERDIVHPGWFVQTRDVGDSKAYIASYLWRLICSNGLTLRSSMAREGLRHRFNMGWDGATIGMPEWQAIIDEARHQLFAVPDVEEAHALMSRYTEKVPGVPTSYVSKRLYDCYHMSLVLKEPFSRWHMAQLFAAFPQELDLPAFERSNVQALAGRVLMFDIEKSMPALEPLLVRRITRE